MLLMPVAAKKPPYANTKPAQPAGVSGKKLKPSWMREKEISVSRTNPYTGKKSKHYWVSPEAWNQAHQYRSTLMFTTDLGMHYTECPYYQNTELGNVKGMAMPSVDVNVMYTFGGNLMNNFGVFAGVDYAYSYIPRRYYDICPEGKGWIMDYRFGVSIMKYAAVGFQMEYNSYLRQYEQPAYRVDPMQYGFYVMGIYRLGHHIGANISFSYMFNSQWNTYNERYVPELYVEKHPIMNDFAIHAGLVFYIGM